ncbi:type VI secretion system baseplate subunit TssG [Capnocytophaga canis]|uniref:type VI secretion system baseplate subunit TssG n=1 Tax=Capnocytophaga canis TaxID=1848903 RepID=UPI0037D4B7D2
MDKLEQIALEINRFKYDVRAEVLLNNLLQSGEITSKEYVVNYQGQSARSYRFDVLGAQVVDFNYDASQFLEINLSRDSLYDLLPESITHNIKNEKQGKSVETMIQEYKIRKRQEKAARQFFSPFENEFFNMGVAVESFESTTFKELNSDEAPKLLYQLWDIPTYFPKYLASKFIKLLPYTHKIVGDIPLASAILSELLGESVQVKDNEFEQYAELNQGVRLGNEIRLGVDLIIGEDYEDYTKHLVLEIGPIKKASFSEFILNGKILEFIKMYCEYFFPLEVETQVEIILSEQERYFQIKEEQPTFLGYNTFI